ncbi:hypothetical protein ACH5RR_032408 [Cinchona calisaya]|uniref:Uncharacterized protein n=1 Tax=Cinchona calisaya TaxID=153742 RepID=A0ABD2YJZ4_9GENT
MPNQWTAKKIPYQQKNSLWSNSQRINLRFQKKIIRQNIRKLKREKDRGEKTYVDLPKINEKRRLVENLEIGGRGNLGRQRIRASENWEKKKNKKGKEKVKVEEDKGNWGKKKRWGRIWHIRYFI